MEENNVNTATITEQVSNEELNTKPAYICAKCGTTLEDGQDFCPKCGTPREGEKKRICIKCGAELKEEQEFCPKCGTKYVSDNKLDKKAKKGSKAKILIPVIAVVLLAAIGVVLFFIFKDTPVTDVSFTKNEMTIVVGKTATVVFTVTPDNATDKTLTWSSSNESVAKVDGTGVITAVSAGVCTITATSNNGKTAECKVTVEKAGPDFKALYSKYCKATWANNGSDGSFLSIDTNPLDWDDSGLAYPEAYEAIENINKALGLPSSLIYDMGHTTANQGKQSETFNDAGVTVTWSYHPDKGLEVVYKAINK